MSTLYVGDNLSVLREHVPSESVDLVYLDPPFNSNRDYNVLFAAEESEAPIRAFKDSWTWDTTAERTLRELTDPGADVPPKLVTLMEALRLFLGTNDMLAYLAMMAIRIVELHRVLKPAGSLWLHCDPTASHYLKLVLDAVFGHERFVNEVAWKRTSGHSDAGRCGRVHDILLFYAKGEEWTWNKQFTPYKPNYVEQYYRYTDDDGRRWMSGNLSAAGLSGGGYEYEWKGIKRIWRCPRSTMERLDGEGRIFYTKNGIPRLKRYLDESKGLPIQDVWNDISPINSQASERLGYPTQKPVALLERIIAASSNEGDVVLDPFCGCGTTIDAAQRLGREWIGIDVTYIAIGLVRSRLDTAFGGEAGAIKYTVKLEPVDEASALALAETDKYQFQWWAVFKIGARPFGAADAGSREGKKGGDRGIDGIIRFKLHPDAPKSEQAIVSVKAGQNLRPEMVRDLRGVIEREKAPIGVMVTMHPPTAEMRVEAARAGEWKPDGWDRAFPCIQILTVADMFAGKRIEYPGMGIVPVDLNRTLKPAPREGTLPLPGLSTPTGGKTRRRTSAAG